VAVRLPNEAFLQLNSAYDLWSLKPDSGLSRLLTNTILLRLWYHLSILPGRSAQVGRSSG